MAHCQKGLREIRAHCANLSLIDFKKSKTGLGKNSVDGKLWAMQDLLLTIGATVYMAEQMKLNAEDKKISL